MPVVGVISDTHGLLRPEALEALAGVEQIVHAGDIGSPEIIERLQRIAPVTAVRGNNDKAGWADAFAPAEVLDLAGRLIYVLHDVAELDFDPAAAGFAAVIAGHSHKPQISEKDGVLFLNPGSAGPRRFKLPIALARLYIDEQVVRAEIQELRVER